MTVPPDDRRASERIDVSDAGVGHRFGHFRHSLVQGGAFAMALALFFFAANVIDPGQSSARGGSATPNSASVVGPMFLASSGSLGSLISLEHTVEIHATVNGPRYTVRDAQGVVLGVMLDAAGVEIVAPGLELDDMYAQPMMLAEPRYTFEH